jgi:aspartate/methionine/tyrosine aminotransferase
VHRPRCTGLPGLIEPGDEILMPDPSYPCNRQFVSAAEGKAVLIAHHRARPLPAQREQVEAAWGPRTRGVLLASPSNPTGTSIHPDMLRATFTRWCNAWRHHAGGRNLPGPELRRRQYGQTALALDDNIISINSFSKYFNMTGWRLGWMVVPENWCPSLSGWRKTCSSAPAPLPNMRRWRVLSPKAWPLYEAAPQRIQGPARLLFLPQLNAMGLTVPVMPDGAFYAWADCSAACAKLGIQGQLGLCLCGHEQGPCGHHTGARLWQLQKPTLCALFHRQLHGAPAGSRSPLRLRALA